MATTKPHRACAGHQSCKAEVKVWLLDAAGKKIARYCINHAEAVSLTLPATYQLILEDGSVWKPTRASVGTESVQDRSERSGNNSAQASQTSGHQRVNTDSDKASRNRAADSTARTPRPDQQTAGRPSPPAASDNLPAPRGPQEVSFAGAGTLTLNPEETAILAQAWPENGYQIRDDGEVYVPWQGYAERLTAALGAFGWALVPLEKPFLKGQDVFVHYALFVRGIYVADAVESHRYYANNSKVSYDSAIESAKSECLRRLCKGRVGDLQAWDRSFREQWKNMYCVQVFRKVSDRRAWRRIDSPPFDDEGDPRKSSESEYKQPRTMDDEAKAHMNSIMGEGEWSDFADDAREEKL